ncbi:MAG: hypothetical protein PUB67_01420 [Clostridiales bacterium]|nr:hypothetical protein [Clostridiales bacterium]
MNNFLSQEAIQAAAKNEHYCVNNYIGFLTDPNINVKLYTKFKNKFREAIGQFLVSHFLCTTEVDGFRVVEDVACAASKEPVTDFCYCYMKQIIKREPFPGDFSVCIPNLLKPNNDRPEIYEKIQDILMSIINNEKDDFIFDKIVDSAVEATFEKHIRRTALKKNIVKESYVDSIPTSYIELVPIVHDLLEYVLGIMMNTLLAAILSSASVKDNNENEKTDDTVDKLKELEETIEKYKNIEISDISKLEEKDKEIASLKNIISDKYKGKSSNAFNDLKKANEALRSTKTQLSNAEQKIKDMSKEMQELESYYKDIYETNCCMTKDFIDRMVKNIDKKYVFVGLNVSRMIEKTNQMFPNSIIATNEKEISDNADLVIFLNNYLPKDIYIAAKKYCDKKNLKVVHYKNYDEAEIYAYIRNTYRNS